MHGNVTLSLETVPTIITLEISHPRVSEGMSIETRNGTKSFATLITLIILNTNVRQGVFVKVRLVGKFLATLITHNF